MMQLDLFPTDLHLRCIDPASNKRRFYALSVQRTLFDEWVLVREWGRIGVSGRLRRDPYSSAGPALDALHEIARQKTRRGYQPVAAT
ncbi:WGR domain-containing protein (plasmid) [Acuticoccus sp. MNP-M23]|uniref:WGR domain-containing protein n=1 Tax=Acuticoccus sp. MNP-M23 TaxID=3072793 RepID=UPI002815ED16|nr:WGR domain-containing protein [Acuticoccus sp. MNP-M23]WMS45265.1 WGR domain-containing protein [Acuticoccus sp. MNP-M23]